MFVIVTTCQNGTHSMLTSAKLLVSYLVVGIYKRTRQGALTVLLSYLYKLHVVHTTIMSCFYFCPKGLMSILCLPAVTVQDCASYPNVHMSNMW